METIKGILFAIWKFIKKRWHYLLLLVLFIISLAIPFGINEAYKVGEGYITLWGAPDVLAFYGAYISFIGTVVLGVIAVEQNKKAHRLNEQMQKLQQAQFVSMVSVKRLEIDKRSSKYPNYVNTNMREIEVLNCTGSGVKSDYCYHIDVEFANSSPYPIVQINAQAGSRNNSNYLLWGMTNFTEKAIYIPEQGTKAIRFIIPSVVFEKLDSHKISLSLKFTNVFDYATFATIHIDDLENTNRRNEYQFRLAKFTDVKG